MGISLAYALYILIFRPYKSPLLHIRSFINESTICLIAGASLYYKNYT